MSTLDPFLDQTFIDLQGEIESIKNGRKPIESFTIMKFLQKEEQQNLISDPGSIGIINALFNQFVHKQYSTIKIMAEFFTPLSILNYLVELKNDYDFLKTTISLKSYYATEFCILQKGTHDLLATTIFLTMKRFHQQFGLKNFLFSFISDNSYFPIFRQMVQSRLNYMMHGEYLPIIILFFENIHTTSLIILPSDLHGDLGDITWHFIHINSNGDAASYHERFDDIPRAAFSAYVDFSTSFQHQSKFTESHCVENIQKSYGTCVPWSILLAVFIFASVSSFPFGETDLISVFCKNVAKATSDAKTLHRFHQHIIDFTFSFQHLTLELYYNAAARLGLPAVIGQMLPEISFEHFMYELIHGIPSDSIRLDVKILQSMRDIQHRFRKYVKSSVDDSILEQSDDETAEEKKYQHKFAKQEKHFKTFDDTCKYLQQELVQMMGELEKVGRFRKPDKCKIGRLERQFMLKANDHSMWLSEFTRRGQQVNEWTANWFFHQTEEEISKCEQEIQRLSHELDEHSETPKNQKKLETEIGKFQAQKELLLTKIRRELFKTDAVTFLRFVSNVQTKVTNAESRLRSIQKELDELRKTIISSRHSADSEDLRKLYILFQDKFDELLVRIEHDIGCGKNASEWLEYWFKCEIFSEMKQSFDDIRQFKNTGSRIPDEYIQKWEMLRANYKNDTSKKMALDFLTFVKKTEDIVASGAARSSQKRKR